MECKNVVALWVEAARRVKSAEKGFNCSTTNKLNATKHPGELILEEQTRKKIETEDVAEEIQAIDYQEEDYPLVTIKTDEETMDATIDINLRIGKAVDVAITIDTNASMGDEENAEKVSLFVC